MSCDKDHNLRISIYHFCGVCNSSVLEKEKKDLEKPKKKNRFF